MPTDSAQQALDPARWKPVPVDVSLLLLVLYVYANEIERRNWNVVFRRAARSSVWTGSTRSGTRSSSTSPSTRRSGRTADPAFLILIGLNIEIS
jgi:hypothetical protein